MTLESSPKRSASGGLLWMFSGRSAFGVVQVAAIVILARLLDQSEFGAATIVLLLAQLGAWVSTCGMGPALVQRADIEPRHVSSALVLGATGGVIIGALLYFGRSLLGGLFKMGDSEASLGWLLVLVPFAAITQVAHSVAQRFHHFRLISVTETFCFMGGYAGLSIILASSGFGADSLLIGQLATYIGTSAIYLSVLRAWSPAGASLISITELSQKGLGFGLAEIVGWFSQNIDKFLIAQFLNLASVGIYGRAAALTQSLTTLLTYPLDAVLFPAFSRAQKQPQRMRELFEKSNVLVVMLCFCPAVVLVAAPEAVVQVVLGAKWIEAASVLVYFGAFLVFRIGYRVTDLVLRSRGMVCRRLLVIVANCGFVTVGVIAGTSWGVAGVALAVSLSSVFLFVTLAWLALTASSFSVYAYTSSLFLPIFWGGVTAFAGRFVANELSPILPAWVVLLVIGAISVAVISSMLLACPVVLFGRGATMAVSIFRETRTVVIQRLKQFRKAEL